MRKRMAVPAAPISMMPDVLVRAFSKTFVSSLFEIFSMDWLFSASALRIRARLLMLFDAGKLIEAFISDGGVNRYFILCIPRVFAKV